MHLLASILLVALITMVHCYSGGAPSSACTSLRPFHSYSSKIKRGNENSSYLITTDPIQYKSGQIIKVKILKKYALRYYDFRGFMLKARIESGKGKIGKFIIEPKERYKYKSKCSDMVVTHRSAKKVESVEVDFKLDADFNGNLEFIATVVRVYSDIYMDITSGVISLAPEPTSAPIAPLRMLTLSNDTNSTDITKCEEKLLTPLSQEFPQVAIMCTTSFDQCPCGWTCCSRCDQVQCAGHSICRKPLTIGQQINGTLSD